MSASPVTFVHASAVVIGETGVLIRGASGAGKSALALALLRAADPDRKFARLIGDDRIGLSVTNGRVLAMPHPVIAGRIEERGSGLLECGFEPCARLGCIIDLVDLAPQEQAETRFPEAIEESADISGVILPCLRLWAGIAPGEAAARVHAFLARIHARD